MVINLYYGGRGLIEDPCLYVCDKIIQVFDELHVTVRRYNLYEEKSSISMLPKSLKEADAVILASSVEWFGIGGLMLQFLDSCWLYGDKEKIKGMYMMPVVTSTTYGEEEAMCTLTRAWKVLGGAVTQGICTYVEDNTEFELNTPIGGRIETIAEDLYRTVNQRRAYFPSSESVVKHDLYSGTSIPLTPQESEQLSEYVSNDTYVKKQKEDIEELSQMFTEMLGSSNKDSDENDIIKDFRNHFKPKDDFLASYRIELTDKNTNLILEIDGRELKVYFGEKDNAMVSARTTSDVLNDITNGSITFQRAFMSGSISAKGNFKTLRMFDEIFPFSG